MCARSLHACTMTQLGLLETSRESRSTFAESMVRRSGSVKSVPSGMLFNQTGKLTPRFVAQESIDVTVEPFSPGKQKGTTYLIDFNTC